MAKIYTKTGDLGETGLFDGTRVSKADARVGAYGDIDELNAWLGLIRAQGVDGAVAGRLEQMQRDLFAVGAMLADPRHKIAARVSKALLTQADVDRLEGWIDEWTVAVPPLTSFILAGGVPAGASIHVARTVCRRAERAIVALGDAEVDPIVVVFVNRLSDLLFVLARYVNHRAGAPEIEW